jgi:hypothetical protein
MTGDEHKTQQVVTDVIVERGFEIRHECLLPGIELTTKLLVLALEELVAAKEINGAMLGGGHEPGTRVLRDARLLPLLERGNQRILGEILGKTYIAHDSHEAADEPGRFDSPDGVNRATYIGGGHSHR